MNQSWLSLLLMVLSVLLGGAITWFVAWHHYVEAAKDLTQEAGELRHLTTMVLRSLENAGLAELNRDKSGKIIGLVISLRGSLTGTASLSAKAEVIHRKSGNEDMTEANDVGTAKDPV